MNALLIIDKHAAFHQLPAKRSIFCIEYKSYVTESLTTKHFHRICIIDCNLFVIPSAIEIFRYMHELSCMWYNNLKSYVGLCSLPIEHVIQLRFIQNKEVMLKYLYIYLLRIILGHLCQRIRVQSIEPIHPGKPRGVNGQQCTEESDAVEADSRDSRHLLLIDMKKFIKRFYIRYIHILWIQILHTTA